MEALIEEWQSREQYLKSSRSEAGSQQTCVLHSLLGLSEVKFKGSGKFEVVCDHKLDLTVSLDFKCKQMPECDCIWKITCSFKCCGLRFYCVFVDAGA